MYIFTNCSNANLENSIYMYPFSFQDDHLENSRKVPLDRHDIIIDKVAASHDNNYVVSVTSNNMVCIWKRVTSESGNNSTAESS